VFTHKYIFPQDRYWKYDGVPSNNKDLKTIKRWYLNGYNYSTTFVNWLKNFDDSQAIVKDLDYGID
jgi:cyclopropane-fatty-acyl-phospholipid synthase